MRGSLGDKIGEGAMADVHAWAPGQVVKLFKPGVPRRIGEHEANMTRAAFAVGAPAPEVLGEVTVAGRFGNVLPRLEGPSLLELLKSRAMTFEEAGALLASLYLAVHRTPAPPEVLSLRDCFAAAARFSAVLTAKVGSCFSRSFAPQAGQDGGSSAGRTSASNSCPHERHSKSKSGTDVHLQT